MSPYHLMDKSILKAPAWFHIQAYYSHLWTHHRMLPHAHDRVEIMYVVSGSCNTPVYSYDINPRSNRAVITDTFEEKLESGEFILLDSGTMHKLKIIEPCTILNVELEFVPAMNHLTTIGKLAEQSVNLKKIINCRKNYLIGSDRFNKLQNAMSETIEQASRGTAVDAVLTDVLIAKLLLVTAECLNENQVGLNVFHYVKQIEKYVAVHLDSDINEEEMVAELGISKNYMQRIIRAHKGMPLIKYVNSLRIEKSKRLLTSYGNYTMADIAASCGFNSRQHFARVFKSYTGVSPMNYKLDSFKRLEVTKSGDPDSELRP